MEGLSTANLTIKKYVEYIKDIVGEIDCKIDPLLIFPPCIYSSVIYEITYKHFEERVVIARGGTYQPNSSCQGYGLTVYLDEIVYRMLNTAGLKLCVPVDVTVHIFAGSSMKVGACTFTFMYFPSD